MQLFAKAAFSLSLKRREVCLMNFPLFTGCATALITPFLPDGKLDEPRFAACSHCKRRRR